MEAGAPSSSALGFYGVDPAGAAVTAREGGAMSVGERMGERASSGTRGSAVSSLNKRMGDCWVGDVAGAASDTEDVRLDLCAPSPASERPLTPPSRRAPPHAQCFSSSISDSGTMVTHNLPEPVRPTFLRTILHRFSPNTRLGGLGGQPSERKEGTSRNVWAASVGQAVRRQPVAAGHESRKGPGATLRRNRPRARSLNDSLNHVPLEDRLASLAAERDRDIEKVQRKFSRLEKQEVCDAYKLAS